MGSSAHARSRARTCARADSCTDVHRNARNAVAQQLDFARVRAGSHANTLMKTASPTLRDRALDLAAALHRVQHVADVRGLHTL